MDDKKVDLKNLNESKNSFVKSNSRMSQNLKNNYNKNDSAVNKLNNIQNKINNRPINNQNNNSSENSEENNGNKEKKESINPLSTKKIKAHALSTLTGGIIDEKLSSKLIGFSSFFMSSKIMIIIFLFVLIVPIIIAVLMLGFSDSEVGKDTYKYVATNNMTEKELFEVFEKYGYCKDEVTCKKAGSYKFFQELKKLYEDYGKSCGQSVKIDEPCGIKLNIGLIIETINYYQNATGVFADKIEEKEENEGLLDSIKNWFLNLQEERKKKKELDSMISDLKDLSLAQAEYVEETCNSKKRSFYQISFNKYISYLKYGKSSTHPNYQGNAVVNSTCIGPKNDYISISKNKITVVPQSTDFIKNSDGKIVSISGSGINIDIVNYALQFVGNPYVWGGTDLVKGADCSGFTMKVMEHFGYSLPHSSTAQINSGENIGTDISQALPGDLIIYDKRNNIGHVALYMGNNHIVHASSEKTGIKIDDKADYRDIIGIVRVWS